MTRDEETAARYQRGLESFLAAGRVDIETTRRPVDVDSVARRQAILFEVAAVATRYEQDTLGRDTDERWDDLYGLITGDMSPSVLVELAGRCVAWLEHLEQEDGT
jgi:hypothetical protein